VSVTASRLFDLNARLCLGPDSESTTATDVMTYGFDSGNGLTTALRR